MQRRKMRPWAAILSLLAASLSAAQAAGTGETNVALKRAAYQSSAINYDNVAHLAEGTFDVLIRVHAVGHGET